MRSHRKGILGYWEAIVMLILLILSALAGIAKTSTNSESATTSESSTVSSSSLSTSTSLSVTPTTDSRSDVTSSSATSSMPANITTHGLLLFDDPVFPANYTVLAAYLLGLINQDRAAVDDPPVTLSSVPSGQVHADSELVEGYYSHYDTQGYNPPIRYSLLNGTGSVDENIIAEGFNVPYFTSIPKIEGQLFNLENTLMFNDSTCCQNGHELNIIDHYHNQVSIGIAYTTTNLYLVEDFQDDYLTWNAPFTSIGSLVTLSGNSSLPLSIENTQVSIYYSDIGPLTPAQLSVGKYQPPTPYTIGTLLGFVGRCNFPCSSKVVVNSSAWSITPTSIDVRFSLQPFIEADGPGVYTVVLTTDFENIVDISFFT